MLNGPGGASIIGLGYDVRGNVINNNGNLFVFDYGNRLRTAQGMETYRYDAQGRRVLTASADGLLYEVYSLDGKLLWQRDEQIGLRFQNVYPGRALAASRRALIGRPASAIPAGAIPPIDPAQGRPRPVPLRCLHRQRHGEGTMHPILRDMLTQPVGWLTICGALIILGIPVFTVFFIRRRLREEQRNQR